MAYTWLVISHNKSVKYDLTIQIMIRHMKL